MISVDLVVYGRDESPTKLAIVAKKILPSCVSSRFENPRKMKHVSFLNYDWPVAKMNELLRKRD